MVSFTFATAWVTPLPPYRFGSWSRSSSASREPVDAPEGIAARPSAPPRSATSTSTVGIPLESSISLAYTDSISVMRHRTLGSERAVRQGKSLDGRRIGPLGSAPGPHGSPVPATRGGADETRYAPGAYGR